MGQWVPSTSLRCLVVSDFFLNWPWAAFDLQVNSSFGWVEVRLLFNALHGDFEICFKQLFSHVLDNVNLSYPKICNDVWQLCLLLSLYQVFRQKLHRPFKNVKIVSNRMMFDDSGNLVAFKGIYLTISNKIHNLLSRSYFYIARESFRQETRPFESWL